MMKNKWALTDYEIVPELAKRWSPRAFADKAVEEEKLLLVLEAARWAASSYNEQPWRFFIGKKGEGELQGESEKNGESENIYQKLFKGLNKWNQKWAFTAPVLGVTIAKKAFSNNDKENKHAWHDVGLAMGNVSAQATNLNLKVHQMAGIEHDYLYEALQIPKAEYDVVSMFAIGYQDEERLQEIDEQFKEPELAKRTRKSLNEIVFEGQFGLTPNWITNKEIK